MSIESSELVVDKEPGAESKFARGSIFFVGTATVVLRYAGFTILTDPNFLHSGDHVHLGYGLTSERLTDPAIDIEELPPLDLCVLSHLHGDHFDRVAEERLNKSLPIITTRHAAASLRRKGFNATHGLDTWESFTATKDGATLRITSMPGKHGPGPLNALLPPVMGSVLEFKTADGAVPLRLYITGDTLVHEDLREIPRRYPDIDLALLHLGGTRIFGVLLTMDARQGVEAIKIIRPRKAVPIHYNDYTVFKSPLVDFKRAVRRAGLEDRIVYLSHGETYDFEVPASNLLRRDEQPAFAASEEGARGRQRARRPAAAAATGRRARSSPGALALLGAVGAGAALIYLFDPKNGRRRRALLRDKLVSAANSLSDAAGAKARDLRNRAQGLAAETRSAFSPKGDEARGRTRRRQEPGRDGLKLPGPAL